MVLLVDDHTLSGLLRGEIHWPDEAVFTTGCWYVRLCQAVVRGGGGSLSAPLASLAPGRRERALQAILELPEGVSILGWELVAPLMATQLGGPGRRLNLLGREALAAATVLDAEVVMAPGNEHALLAAALVERGG